MSYLHMQINKPLVNRHNSTIVLCLWVFILSVFYSILAVIQHDKFHTGGLDLGIYDQAIWQYGHFEWPYNSVYDRFILGDHLTLTLPIIAPLYWLWNDVRILLIFQAVFVAVSGIAVYLLARYRKQSRVISLCLTISYTVFYGFQYAIFQEFHPIILGVGLLIWLAYFFESGRWRWFWITLPLALLTQENMGLAVACLGLVYLFHPKHRRAALLFIAGGVAYNLVTLPIVASFSPIGYEYAPRLAWNPLGAAILLFNHPEKLQVWWYSLSSFLFLPLLSPGAMLATGVDIFQYFVLGDRFVWMRPPSTYHRAILAVFLTLGTLDTLRFFKKKRISTVWAAYGIVGIAIVGTIVYRFPLMNLIDLNFWTREQWMINADKLFSRISPSASIATQQDFAPHLSHRTNISVALPRQYFSLPNPCNRLPCWWYDFERKPDYLIVTRITDVELGKRPTLLDEFQMALINMEKAGAITAIDSDGIVTMYQVR